MPGHVECETRSNYIYDESSKLFAAGKYQQALPLLKRLFLSDSENREFTTIFLKKLVNVTADNRKNKKFLISFAAMLNKNHDIHIFPSDIKNRDIENCGYRAAEHCKALKNIIAIYVGSDIPNKYQIITALCENAGVSTYINDPDVQTSFGEAYEALRDYTNAEIAYKKALYLNKTNSERYKNMAAFLTRTNADPAMIRLYAAIGKLTIKIEKAKYDELQEGLNALTNPSAAAGATTTKLEKRDHKLSAPAASVSGSGSSASSSSAAAAGTIKVKLESKKDQKKYNPGHMFSNFRSSSAAKESPPATPPTKSSPSLSPPTAVVNRGGKRKYQPLTLSPTNAAGGGADQTVKDVKTSTAEKDRKLKRYGSVVAASSATATTTKRVNKKLKTDTATTPAALVTSARAKSIGKITTNKSVGASPTPPSLVLYLSPDLTQQSLPPTQPQDDVVPETPPNKLRR